jgi:deazaflavin-dependent oxidoreductase (nitroreductase family)
MSVTSQVLRFHDALYKRTNGRIGHKWLGMPTLLLSSTGRRSGQTRVNSLVYARDGDDYILVASKGGADEHPGWLHNVRAHPDVEVQVGRERSKATAKVLGPEDPDYARAWKLANDGNSNRYDAYQEKTSRPIPVVVVTPVR